MLGVKVAVLGCGHWGKNLVRNFAELGALAAIVEPRRDIAQALSDQYGVPVHTLQEVLDTDDIGGLVIATPAITHADLTKRALLAGKDVFVEKPLALDVADAEEVRALAADNGRVLMVGHLLQYHPAFRKLMTMVSEGDLGRLRYAYSTRLNLGKFRREENILWSFAPHDISMLLTLFGEPPAEVFATGSAFVQTTIADLTTTHITFPGGGRAHIFVSWLHPFKEQKLVVIGDKGMAVFNDGEPWDSKLLVYPHRVNWHDGVPEAVKVNARPIAVEAAEPLRNECEEFIRCISNRAVPRTDGKEGLSVLKILRAAETSMREGQWVTVDKPPKARVEGVMIHESAYVDDPVEILPGTRIWHFSHILSDVRIGQNCVIGQNVVIGPKVTIGDSCKIQNNVSLYQGVTLEDSVFCGPSCVFTNVANPRAHINRKSEFQPTLVKTGATIGANATIVCGTTLGEYSFIAAGAVVAADVPSHALMAGVPARRIGWMSHAGVRLDDTLICPQEGRRYRENGPNQLIEITE